MPKYKIEWAVDIDAPDVTTALETARAKVRAHEAPGRITNGNGLLIHMSGPPSPDVEVIATEDKTPRTYIPRNYGTPVTHPGRDRSLDIADWLVLFIIAAFAGAAVYFLVLP